MSKNWLQISTAILYLIKITNKLRYCIDTRLLICQLWLRTQHQYKLTCLSKKSVKDTSKNCTLYPFSKVEECGGSNCLNLYLTYYKGILMFLHTLISPVQMILAKLVKFSLYCFQLIYHYFRG